MGSNDLVK